MDSKEVVEEPRSSASDASKSDEVTSIENAPGESSTPDISYVITGQAFRSLIDERIDKKPKSWVQVFSSNALIVVVVGGAISVGLTHYYTSQQQDLQFKQSIELQRLSRLDDLNKLRIEKVAQVLEQLAKDEHLIDKLIEEDSLLERPVRDANVNKRVDDIRKLIDDDQALASRNRFWLGEKGYLKVAEYLDKSVQLALNRLMVPSETDLGELVKNREAAKLEVLKSLYVESLFWEGQSNAQTPNVSH